VKIESTTGAWLQSAKYRPLMPASSGDAATRTLVAAPRSRVLYSYPAVSIATVSTPGSR
jgi:hypothetical protein